MMNHEKDSYIYQADYRVCREGCTGENPQGCR